MKSKIISGIVLFCISLPLSFSLAFSPVHADTLILKNGREIKADRVWQEDGVVKYSRYGSVVGHPKADVLEVVHDAVHDNQDGRIDSFFSLGNWARRLTRLCHFARDMIIHYTGTV